MKRSASFLAVLMFFAVVAVLLANSPSAEAGENCQDKLVGKAYNCDFKFSNETSTTYCLEFVTGGSSSNFDLLIGLSGDFGCACQATGSFKSPKFDASASAFECADDFGDQLDGKVASKTISGEGTAYDGVSIVFSCEQIKACT